MRERELSIRQAIGASRVRLAQYLLSEAIVLACAGGALASLVLFNIPSLLSWLTGDPIPPQIAGGAAGWICRWSRSVFGLCLLTSLVFGWLPAMRFSRPVIISSLKDDAGGGGGMRVGRVHRVTAALQVAIAVPLLVMSGQSLDRHPRDRHRRSRIRVRSLIRRAVEARRPGHRSSWLPDPEGQRHARARQRCGVRHCGGRLAARLPGPQHAGVASGGCEHRPEAGCRPGDARRRRISEDDGHPAGARARLHRRGWRGRRAGDHHVETARRSSRARRRRDRQDA